MVKYKYNQETSIQLIVHNLIKCLKLILFIKKFKIYAKNNPKLIKAEQIIITSNSKIKTIRYLIIINDNPARSIAMKFFNIIIFASLF